MTKTTILDHLSQRELGINVCDKTKRFKKPCWKKVVLKKFVPKKWCRKKLESAVKEIDVVKKKVDEKLDGTYWV